METKISARSERAVVLCFTCMFCVCCTTAASSRNIMHMRIKHTLQGMRVSISDRVKNFKYRRCMKFVKPSVITSFSEENRRAAEMSYNLPQFFFLGCCQFLMDNGWTLLLVCESLTTQYLLQINLFVGEA